MFLPNRVKMPLAVVGLVILAFMTTAFGGCSATSKVTDGAGNPVLGGPICVDTANGKFCYTPGAQPGNAATTPPLEK